MTVLVGILCSDGVVIASDSDATFGTGQMSTIGQQPTQKVHKLGNSMIFAGTGAVGISQMVADKLDRGWKANEFRHNSAEELMQKMGVAISSVVHPFLQSAVHLQGLMGNANGSLCKTMVAVTCKGEPCMFSFEPNGTPERATKELPFLSMGSGQTIADPFLAFLKRLIWSTTQPTLAEGKLVSVWTIDQVCRTNPGGVGGAVQLMVLTTKPEILDLDPVEAEEHRQLANGAEQALVRHLRPPPGVAPIAPALPVPPAP